MILVQAQRDLIVGSMLGDGSLQSSTGTTWRFRTVQKALHKDYVFDKYEILKEFCGTEPRFQSFKDKRSPDNVYGRWYFNTLVTPELNEFANLFYEPDPNKNGRYKKKIPSNIADYLTPQALAWWYMDDGALKWAGKSNEVRFCTDSFSDVEISYLMEAMQNKFQLKVSTQKIRQSKRICVLEESYSTLRELIVTPNYLKEYFYYKFPDGNYGILNKENIQGDIFDGMRDLLLIENDTCELLFENDE